MQVLQLYAVSAKINEKLQMMIKQEKIKEKWNNFMKNDTLGTIDEMRAQLELDYIAKNFRVNVGSKKRKLYIDAMIIIPIPNLPSSTLDDKIAKGRNFLKKVFSNAHDISSENLMVEIPEDDDDFEDLKTENLVFVNQPNAAVYELMCYESSIIDLFVNKNVTVLMWNYRGYGRSQGAPGFGNMAEDARKLLKVVKDRLSPRKIAVYGRSLGGHVAKALSFEVDLVIIDRTFSSISKWI